MTIIAHVLTMLAQNTKIEKRQKVILKKKKTFSNIKVDR